MIIRTRNSIYEIDFDNKRVRRLTGTAAPTPRQKADGEYRDYLSIAPNPPIVGESLLIIWDPTTTPLMEGSEAGATPITLTSVVVKIDEPMS